VLNSGKPVRREFGEARRFEITGRRTGAAAVEEQGSETGGRQRRGEMLIRMMVTRPAA
jgi:hypothetical protein